MSSILDALRRIEREEDERTQAPFDPGPEPPPAGSGRRWLWIGGTVAIVAGLSAGFWFLDDESGEGPPSTQELARAPEPEPDHVRKEPGREPREAAPAGQHPARKNRKHARGVPPGDGDQKRAGRRQKPDAGHRATREARRRAAAAERKARRATRAERTRDPVDRPGDSPEEVATPRPELAAAARGQPRANVPPASAPEVTADPVPIAEQKAAWKRPFVNPPPSEESDPLPPDSPAAAPAPSPARPGNADAPIAVARAGTETHPPEVMAPAPGAADELPVDDDRTHGPRSRAEDPTRTSRIDRLEDLNRRRSIRRDLAPVAPDALTPEPHAPSAEPEAPTEDEESAEEVLQRRPTGAPHVSVNFLFYSREAARRRIMVTVDQGSLVTLFEGQSVDTLAVERILPNEVHFRYDGKLFAVHPRY